MAAIRCGSLRWRDSCARCDSARPRYRPAAQLLLQLVLLLATGCGTILTAVHDPLYQPLSHTSTITAQATNTAAGIEKVTITVTTGEMVDCMELGEAPSVLPCRINATAVTHVCKYTDGPATAECTYSHILGKGALVTYYAEATPAKGTRKTKTDEITYSGGDPPDIGLARPVWWHRGQAAAKKIDIAFFPDEDYTGLYTEFADDVNLIVRGSFFNMGQDFSSTYSSFKSDVNLWVGPFGADQVGCSKRLWDVSLTPIISNMDGRVILHKEKFRDCSTVGLGGSGSVYAKAANADWLFTHESGHFLHGQGDEYCCDGGYWTTGRCANVFPTKAACQAAACGHKADRADCVQIGSLGAWRNAKGKLETMADVDDASRWLDDTGYCVERRFKKCRQGKCY
jgi:hypothetical protein